MKYFYILLSIVISLSVGFFIYKAIDPEVLEKKEIHGHLVSAESNLTESSLIIKSNNDGKVLSNFYNIESEYLEDDMTNIRDSFESYDLDSDVPTDKNTFLQPINQGLTEIKNFSNITNLNNLAGTLANLKNNL